MTTASYFEHYARVNDLSPEGRASYWPMYDRLLSAVLPLDKSAPILDVGCGAGLLLEWLSKQKGYSCAVGIDIDPGQVRFAKELGVNAELVTDASEWLSQQRSFDLVVMSDVLEHAPSPMDMALLSDIRSHVSPSGVLYLKVPNANSSFAGRYRYIDSTHQRSYTEDSLTHDLSCAGFDRIRVSAEPLGFPSSAAGICRFVLLLLVRAIRRLEAIAEFGRLGLRLPLSLNLVATCSRGEP